MLKFEKSARKGEIAILMRAKHPLLSSTFLKAFTCAFSIHLFFILLFHVSTIKISDQGKLLTPSRAEAFLPANSSVAADIAQEESVIFNLPPIERFMPSLPTLESLFIFTRLPYVVKTEDSFPQNLFAELEKEAMEESLFFRKKQTSPAVQVQCSGPLAETKILHMKEWEASVPKIEFKTTAVFEVLVEGKTGEVIWHHLIQSTQNKALDAFAQAVLKELKFDLKQQIFLSGEIELFFNPKRAF